MRRALLPVLLAALVAVTAVACSSSADSSGGGGATTTAAAPGEATTTTLALSPEMQSYVSQVRAVCRDTNARTPTPPADPTPQESQAFLDQILAVAEQQVSGIEAVVPPAGDAEAIRANFTGPMRATLDALVAGRATFDAAAAQGWDQLQQAISDASATVDAFTDANTQWMEANGLFECDSEA